MQSLEDLEEWLTEQGITLVSGRSAVPSAAEAIAGETIAGSWWSHRQGGAIYRLLTELEERTQWLDVALVEGKHTLVAPAARLPLARLAADEERRARVVAGLPPPARRLWDVVSSGEEVRSDDPRFAGKSWRPARQALEAGLLVRSRSEHQDAGHHVATVTTFGEQPEPGSDKALGSVLGQCLHSAVVAETREVLRWLRYVEPLKSLIETAISDLAVRALNVDGRTWLTPAER